GAEHHRRAGGHLAHVVHEDHAQAPEAVHHQLVVDDLVVAVDGGLEDPHHPGQGLYRHLHACAEAAGLRQEHAFDVHGGTATGAPALSLTHVGTPRDGRRRLVTGL